MDIIALLSSLNKIGLVAFLITLGFLIYEIALLNKTKKIKDVPQVPQFQEGMQLLPPTMEIKESLWKKLSKNLTKNNKIILIALSILLIFFGVITLISYINSNTESTRATSIVPTKTLAKKTAPTIKVPTKIVRSPTPTEDLAPSPTETPMIETINPTLTESEEISTQSASPTVIEKLPVTSYVNDSLILFSVSALFLFFAFLF